MVAMNAEFAKIKKSFATKGGDRRVKDGAKWAWKLITIPGD
jgi:hypothetical protein